MNSFLSKDIQEIYSIIPQKSKQETNKNYKYITSNFTLDWSLIKTDFKITFNTEINHDWFKTAITDLSIIIIQSEKAIQEADVNVILHNCLWTNRVQDIERCLKKYLDNKKDSVDYVEVILLLTCIIERALGDVLLLKCKSVPFLLRDLLDTQELLSMMGETPVSRIIICNYILYY